MEEGAVDSGGEVVAAVGRVPNSRSSIALAAELMGRCNGRRVEVACQGWKW